MEAVVLTEALEIERNVVVSSSEWDLGQGEAGRVSPDIAEREAQVVYRV